MVTKEQTFRMLTLLACGVIMALTSAYGQPETLMTVKIPFSFVVGSQAMPAGEYTVERMDYNKGKLIIRSTDGRAARIFLTMPEEDAALTGENLLIFHRYREDYFLSQVRCSGTQIIYELSPSRIERELSRKASEPKHEMVSLAARPEARRK